jgi:hypothetical protein
MQNETELSRRAIEEDCAVIREMAERFGQTHGGMTSLR